MNSKLSPILLKYESIEIRLSQPETVADPQLYTSLIKEYNSLTPLIEVYRNYLALQAELGDAEELASSEEDPDLRAMAAEEVQTLKDKLSECEAELRKMLIPKDPDDDRSVVVEIRAGTGGEEAALFAADLFRMYSMYAQSAGFKVSVASENETELGGFKEITFLCEGKGAYARFKFESGVHRVQRVPVTESQGRIQTSAATVAVLPEMEDVTAADIEIKDSDLIYESCKSSGAGGQHINKTESAVRLTHKPTGIIIECQQERSQLQNKEKALMMLRSKLYHIKKREQEENLAAARKSQVGSGDRSEKIRTYNYPQSRVTDHRIGYSMYDLPSFMNGNIAAMLEALTEADTAEKLKEQDM
ncbi:MAG: peptide chain release factor 1 [Clostridia bacterium]|nr:peptide chain release factor 1 [Clostridia bacterium]